MDEIGSWNQVELRGVEPNAAANGCPECWEAGGGLERSGPFEGGSGQSINQSGDLRGGRLYNQFTTQLHIPGQCYHVIFGRYRGPCPTFWPARASLDL